MLLIHVLSNRRVSTQGWFDAPTAVPTLHTLSGLTYLQELYENCINSTHYTSLYAYHTLLKASIGVATSFAELSLTSIEISLSLRGSSQHLHS